MKKLFVWSGLLLGAVLVALLFLRSSEATGEEQPGLTADEIALIRIYQLSRRVETAQSDIRLSTLEEEWNHEIKNWSVDHLMSLDGQIASLPLTDETECLRPLLQEVVANLLGVVKAVDGGDEAMHAAIGAYYEARNTFYKSASQLSDVLWWIPADVGEVDILALEAASIADEDVRNAFLQAHGLIGNHEYAEALALLLPIQEKVKGLLGEGRLVEMILDCHMTNRSPISDGFAHFDFLLGLVGDFLERKVYSPRIPVLYFYWQTIQQINENGVSNFSTIDYELHHRVFGEQLDVIIDYMQANPTDLWARSDVWVLFSYPTIERFPRANDYGNSVSLHYAHLTRLLEDGADSEQQEEAEIH